MHKAKSGKAIGDWHVCTVFESDWFRIYKLWLAKPSISHSVGIQFRTKAARSRGQCVVSTLSLHRGQFAGFAGIMMPEPKFLVWPSVLLKWTRTWTDKMLFGPFWHGNITPKTVGMEWCESWLYCWWHAHVRFLSFLRIVYCNWLWRCLSWISVEVWHIAHFFGPAFRVHV